MEISKFNLLNNCENRFIIEYSNISLINRRWILEIVVVEVMALKLQSAWFGEPGLMLELHYLLIALPVLIKKIVLSSTSHSDNRCKYQLEKEFTVFIARH